MDGEEQATCSICLNPLLNDAVGALRCGHVFHQECIEKWIIAADARAKCALCNKETQSLHVRRLEFLLSPVPLRSPAEIDRLQIATAEEREHELLSLRSELEAAEAAVQEAHTEIADLQEDVQTSKQIRGQLEQLSRDDEDETEILEAELAQTSANCAKLLVSIDSQNDMLKRYFPVRRACENDQDLHEERRKLIRPTERAGQLHVALVSAIAQEAETCNSTRERITAAEDAENKLSKFKKHEVQIRSELSEEKRLIDAGHGGVNQKRPHEGLDGRSSKVPRQVTVEVADKLRGLDSNFGESDLLFMSLPRRPATAKGLLSRKRG